MKNKITALFAAAIFALNSFSASALVFIETPPQPYNVPDTNYLNIADHEVNPGIFDPKDGQESDIEFTINTDAYVTIRILNDRDELVAELAQNRFYQSGKHRVQWDGEDIYGDLVSDDQYQYNIQAEINGQSGRATGRIVVKRGYDYDYDQETTSPRLKRVFVTKETFDPAHKEKNYIVFTLTAIADVRGEIYDNRDLQIYQFINEKDLAPGTYSIKLDNDELDQQERELSFKLQAENSQGEDQQSGTIKLDIEDTKLNKKPNLYQDSSNGTPIRSNSGKLAISFKLDRDANVSLEIRDDDFLIASPLAETELAAGYHTIYWDLTDDFNSAIQDGVYQYKLIASNFRGRDIEFGNFSIEDSRTLNPFSSNCSGFTDVHSGNQYCEAINWARQNAIIQGFQDGSFKPNNPVSRAQALTMIIEALDIKKTSNNGQNLGFSDANRFGWYADYLRTGLALGVVRGYQDSTFRPTHAVSRAEGLIILLNSARSKDNIIIPTSNYGQPYFDIPNIKSTEWYLSYAWYAQQNQLTNNQYYFYPSDNMTRSELVDMLYRYHQSR